MSVTHVILGDGVGAPVTNAVINEALREIVSDGDELITAWYGSPSPAMDSLYGHLFQKKRTTLLLHTAENPPPKAFQTADFIVTQSVDSLAKGFASSWPKDGKFMVLGQSEFTDQLLMDVHAAVDEPEVLDLGDGLVPVTIDHDEAPAEEAPAEDENVAKIADEDPTEESAPADDGESPLTREEMLSIPYRILKDQATREGVELPKGTGTAVEPLVDALLAAREGTHVAPPEIDVDDVGALLSRARTLLQSGMVDGTVSSGEEGYGLQSALVNVQQALLWYHHGADI